MSNGHHPEFPGGFVRRRGLLVPAGSVGECPLVDEPVVNEPVAAGSVGEGLVVDEPVGPVADPVAVPVVPVADPVADPVAVLAAELAAARDLEAVRREDVWARLARRSEHDIAMADVGEQAAAAVRGRRERARDAAGAEALGVLWRRASRDGARARIRAQIQGSAEVRALRVAAVRRVALVAGLPVLTCFAAWSTTGVQAGVVRLLGLPAGSAAWWASWCVEPALIAVVGLVIIGRAVLRSAGGDTDRRAAIAEWTALGMSLALNVLGGWHGGWDGLPGALPHAVGPLGCAGTAVLVGLFDGYAAAARPWDGAPRLADLPGLAPGPVPAGPAPVPLPVPALPVPAVPAVTGPAGTGGRAGTRPRVSAAAAGTAGRRAVLTARTAVPGGRRPDTVRSAARAHWDAETAAGRTPSGPDLARAAGRSGDTTGVFRRWAREWARERATAAG